MRILIFIALFALFAFGVLALPPSRFIGGGGFMGVPYMGRGYLGAPFIGGYYDNGFDYWD